MQKRIWLFGISVLLWQLHESTVCAQETPPVQDNRQEKTGQNTTATQSQTFPAVFLIHFVRKENHECQKFDDYGNRV